MTGATIHWMTEKIDAGNIILQEYFDIKKDDTSKEVWDGFNKAGAKLFDRLIDLWIMDRIDSKPQSEPEAAVKRCEELPELDWSWDGKKIRNYIRAMTYLPDYYVEFKFGDKEMVIVDKNMLKKEG